MGTRGTTGFIIDGHRKSSYQQYDSYPDGVGVQVLAFARTLAEYGALQAAKLAARALVVVPESGKPTPDQATALAEFTDSGVSTGSDWYATLRNTQGLPELILKSGFITGTESFNQEEYDYVLDLDKELLICYAGDNKLTAIGFDELPTDEDFVKDLAHREELAYAD